jgi:hypothetical protein
VRAHVGLDLLCYYALAGYLPDHGAPELARYAGDRRARVLT